MPNTILTLIWNEKKKKTSMKKSK